MNISILLILLLLSNILNKNELLLDFKEEAQKVYIRSVHLMQ